MKHSVLVVLLLALACPFAQAETQDRQKPIEIQADHFFGDEVKQVATYTGSVRVDQGTMRLTGQKLVLQETSTGYKKGTLTGNLATFRQRRDPKVKGIEEWVSGRAQEIVYEERTGIVTLTGQAFVQRTENGVVKDTARGNKIVYDTIRSRTIIQGNNGDRASTVIAPRSTSR